MLNDVRTALTAAGFVQAVPEFLTQDRSGRFTYPFPGDTQAGFACQPMGAHDLPGVMVCWWGPNQHTAAAGWLEQYRAALLEAEWGVSPLLHYVGSTPLPYYEPVPGENPPWLFVWRKRGTA